MDRQMIIEAKVIKQIGMLTPKLNADNAITEGMPNFLKGLTPDPPRAKNKETIGIKVQKAS